MITGYKIKQLDGEEVLYIYLDFNYEFGNFRKIKDNLKTNIQKLLQKSDVAFKGSIVALVVGGMVIGSMNIKDITKPIYNLNNDIAVSEKVVENLDISEPIIINNEVENFDSVSEEIDNNIVKQDIEEKNYDVPPIQHEINNNEQVEMVIEEPTVQNESYGVEQVLEEESSNKTYINIKRSNGEYQSIEFEEYIIGVVGAEMPAAFNSEALKAQAIISRTYALKALSRGQILTDNESTQSYKDNSQLQNLWGNSYDVYYNKIKDAVMSTEGIYLTYNGQYIEAVYHSTSNGVTENSLNVWGNSFPYLISVESPFDSTNPSFIQEKSISYEELSNKLGFLVDENTEFDILEKTSGNRVASISINGNVYSGTSFRQLLGLRSADFEIQKTETAIIFTTKGYGHGVGMSQYGANGMAKNGYSFTEILLHYYPGVTINY